jgi:DtxR family Mn-dependent transcriptional regulator
MVQKLAAAEPPLVDYRKRYGAVLTADGERKALQTIRHHRLLESFLHHALGYSWDEVHEEAERLEHAVSELLGERIEQFLDYPLHDPHGDPIPSQTLELATVSAVPLPSMAPEQTLTISRVADEDPALLRTLAELQLGPGVRVTMLRNNPLQIAVAGKSVCLPRDVAQHIYVAEETIQQDA